jgi:hypothetical protein
MQIKVFSLKKLKENSKKSLTIFLEFLCLKNFKEILKVFLKKKRNSDRKLKVSWTKKITFSHLDKLNNGGKCSFGLLGNSHLLSLNFGLGNFKFSVRVFFFFSEIL